jgi:hypothetical protein
MAAILPKRSTLVDRGASLFHLVPLLWLATPPVLRPKDPLTMGGDDGRQDN